MLVDRYDPEDVFARVPEVAQQTDPVLKRLDQLLEDDQLHRQVRADLAKRYRYTLVHGRHSTPVEVILRLLLCKHLYGWSYEETTERVADSLVLRWFCRVYFQTVPDKSTLIRWTHTLRPETLHALNDRVVELAKQAKVTTGRKLRLDATCVQTNIHHPTDSGLLIDEFQVYRNANYQGMLGTFVIISIWWLVSARFWFKGPVMQGSEAELAAIERSVGETVIVEGAAGGGDGN